MIGIGSDVEVSIQIFMQTRAAAFSPAQKFPGQQSVSLEHLAPASEHAIRIESLEIILRRTSDADAARAGLSQRFAAWTAAGSADTARLDARRIITTLRMNAL
jgi:hypothetical protein